MTATSTTTTTSAAPPAKLFEIPAESELRIEVDQPPQKQQNLSAAESSSDSSPSGVTVVLREGTCECFGTELAQQQSYKFPAGTKTSLFSWHGCRLSLEGSCRSCSSFALPSRSALFTIPHPDVADKTPLPKYVQLHDKLEETRSLASKNASIPGPTIVIAGPVDSGKSSMCRTLLAWATRAGHQPVFVDLDIGQNGITVPGVVSALVVERPPPVVEGISGCKSAPLALNYGHTSLDKNPALYRALVENMDAIVREKMDVDPVIKRSGIIVNTCGWVEGLGYSLLLHAIKALKADIVAIIDHERLFHFLKNDLQDRPEIDVQLLPKSGGVVTRDTEFRRKTRLGCIREYFYGPSGDLCPHSTVVNMSDVKIYRIGGAPAVPSSALPIGQAPQYDPLCAVEVPPSQDLNYSLVAVVYCTDPSDLLRASVAGFLYISKVDFERRTLTVLSPCPGDLPSRIFVVGTLKWLE